MIQFKSKNQDFIINVPTKVEELDKDYLLKCVGGIKLSTNYALLGIVCGIKVSEFCFTINNSKSQPKLSVSPIFIKAECTKDSDLKCNVGDTVICDNAAIDRGNKINIPSILNTDKIATYLLSDSEYIKSIINGTVLDSEGKPMRDSFMYALQFVIVPVCDIHAISKPDYTFEEKYIVK